MDHFEIADEKNLLDAEEKAKADEKAILEAAASSMYRAHDMFSRNFIVFF